MSGKHEIGLTVNGKAYSVEVRPGTTLVELLRDKLFFSGTKVACSSGSCGACTVLLDGKPVKSCSVLALQANGKNVLTVEGLASGGKLHPIQQAFLEKYAVQCGFCTPGMVMTAMALLAEIPHPTEDEVRAWLVGNLCRCTGYVKIVEAVLAAAQKPV